MGDFSKIPGCLRPRWKWNRGEESPDDQEDRGEGSHHSGGGHIDSIEAASIPSHGVFKYEWRVPFDVNTKQPDPAERGAFGVGDEVWVKPSPPTCTGAR